MNTANENHHAFAALAVAVGLTAHCAGGGSDLPMCARRGRVELRQIHRSSGGALRAGWCCLLGDYVPPHVHAESRASPPEPVKAASRSGGCAPCDARVTRLDESARWLPPLAQE